LLNSIAALYGTGAVASTTAYESIATVTVGSGGSSTITFSSIPNTYTHLQIRGIHRAGSSGTGATDVYLYYNGDTTNTHYYAHQLYGTGSSAGAGSANSPVNAMATVNNGATGSVFAACVVDILDFANNNKYKTLRTLSGVDTNNTNGFIELTSTLWSNTAAITDISITPANGTNWQQFSQFSLYGVK